MVKKCAEKGKPKNSTVPTAKEEKISAPFLLATDNNPRKIEPLGAKPAQRCP